MADSGVEPTGPATLPRSARLSVARLALEFMLIVTGVLAALAVDAWREGRSDRRLAEFYLADVTWLIAHVGFRPATATFEDMTSSGNLRLIENPELRNRLLRYTLYVRDRSATIAANGGGVERRDLPPVVLEPAIFTGLLERLETQIENQKPLDEIMHSGDVLAVLRTEPEQTRAWLQRRQLHAAFVVGDLTWTLANMTIPMLADIRSGRAGEPLAPRAR